MGADTTGTTPPALTAVQMADEIERLKALATQAVEAREAYWADQDSEELSRRSWLGLDRLHRACDPTTITGLITALTTATARLSEVTNEWESCLERDRAHRDEVREYQARLTEVERERDTLEAEIHDICPMARRQHLLGASGSDVLKEQVKYLFWLEGVRDTTNAELRAAQARIEALERERDAASSHNRELLLHLAEAQANLNDIASRLAVEDARTTLQAKTIRGLEAVIREYLDALDVACNHVMRTDDDFASYEPIDARLEAAEEAMKAAITPPPASTGEEPTR